MGVTLRKGEDYYFDENGFMVFTEMFHLKRGYCCLCNCRHCPYKKRPEPPAENTSPQQEDPDNSDKP